MGLERPEDLVTLSRHILHDQRRLKASGDLSLILQSIQLGCKYVSAKVRCAGLINMTGLAGRVNVQGESVQKLDVIANEIFIQTLSTCGQVWQMISEECEDPILVEADGASYCIAFDPLDGSSNVDYGISIGTIFAIYHCPRETGGYPWKKDNLVAAGYALYGSFTMLVLSTGDGVNGFTLDPSLGEFIMTNPRMRIPENGAAIYSINEGNYNLWDGRTKSFVDGMKSSGRFSARYVGSMVADVHRTLLKGGVFMYPADEKSPSGKLRLLYECIPMAFIIEQAGGAAMAHPGIRILDAEITSHHARSPIVLGSRRLVQQWS